MTKNTQPKVPYNMDKGTADALSAMEALHQAEQEALKNAGDEFEAAELQTTPAVLRSIGSEKTPEQNEVLDQLRALRDEIAELKKPKHKNHAGGDAQYICHLGPIPLKQVKDIVDMAVAEGKMISLNGRWLSLTEALDGMSLPPHVPLTAIVQNPTSGYYK